MKSPRSPSASAGLFTCGECCVARLEALISAPSDSVRGEPARASESEASRERDDLARAADPWLRHVSGLGPRMREVANPTNLRFMKSPRSRWCNLPRPLRIHSEGHRPERASCEAGCERSLLSRSPLRRLPLAWLMRELNHAAYAIIDLSPHAQNRVVLHPAEDGR